MSDSNTSEEETTIPVSKKRRKSNVVESSDSEEAINNDVDIENRSLHHQATQIMFKLLRKSYKLRQHGAQIDYEKRKSLVFLAERRDWRSFRLGL